MEFGPKNDVPEVAGQTLCYRLLPGGDFFVESLGVQLATRDLLTGAVMPVPPADAESFSLDYRLEDK